MAMDKNDCLRNRQPVMLKCTPFMVFWENRSIRRVAAARAHSGKMLTTIAVNTAALSWFTPEVRSILLQSYPECPESIVHCQPRPR